MESKRYAGIGSRETPREILLLMEKLAESAARAGWMLRSGAADGADAAFERGCDRANGKKEIFLPWQGFNGHPSGLHNLTASAIQTARAQISWWDSLSDPVRKLHGRNAQQVLGYNLQEPVNCVIYWTEGGRFAGGTATALKIAREMGIPSYWLHGPEALPHIALLMRDSAR